MTPAPTSDRATNGRQPTVYELLKEIDKRYEEQFKAGASALEAADKRYEQRFLAQENALQTALVAQEKAVTAALSAADRAVTKAEAAAEKRFDQFSEVLTEKIDGLLKSRDADAGRKESQTEGQAQGNADRYVLVALIVGIAGVIATFVATHH